MNHCLVGTGLCKGYIREAKEEPKGQKLESEAQLQCTAQICLSFIDAEIRKMDESDYKLLVSETHDRKKEIFSLNISFQAKITFTNVFET